jgi:hypothetical protein
VLGQLRGNFCSGVAVDFQIRLRVFRRDLHEDHFLFACIKNVNTIASEERARTRASIEKKVNNERSKRE